MTKKTIQDKIALVDLDGTIADYDSALLKDLNSIRDPDDPRILQKDLRHLEPHRVAQRQIITRQIGWWRNLKPIRSGLIVVKQMENIGFKIHVLTKGPSTKSQAWSEKVEWVRDYLPQANVTITEDKSLVYGRVLFDDYPDYVTSWLEWRPRGLVVMLKSPVNKDFEHSNVIKIDPDTYSQDFKMQDFIRQKLEEAFERE